METETTTKPPPTVTLSQSESESEYEQRNTAQHGTALEKNNQKPECNFDQWPE